MLKWFFKLLFKWHGWKIDINLPEIGKQSVFLAAPHTSNWDFVYTIACFEYLKIPVRFTIKKEWLKWPFKRLMYSFGAIAIDRSPKVPGEKRLSTVQAMVNLYKEHEHLAITVTPEGTRNLRTQWKTGFYYVAKEANVPIALAYLDYKNKIAGVGKVIWPSDDMEKDMKEIMEFYNIPSRAKFPEKFSVDIHYL
jgi:1-acyl-sn-glycerol-3-phosphate acyltransferase